MSRRIQSDLIICRDCDTIYEYKHTKVRQPVHCTVCGHHLYEKKTRFIHRGFSFALTALILFIPANLFSLINLDKVGNNRNAVVFDGVIDFFRYGKVACGISLFLFCMIFPLIHSFTQAYVCFGLLYKVKLPGMVKALKIHQKVGFKATFLQYPSIFI